MKIRVTYAMNPDVEEKLIVLAERNRRSKSSFIETLIMKEWEQVAPFLQEPKKRFGEPVELDPAKQVTSFTKPKN